MDYVLKPEKAVIVSSQFLNNKEDYSMQIQATAHRFGKNKGTNYKQYYSFVVSPSREDNATPEQSYKLSEEL